MADITHTCNRLLPEHASDGKHCTACDLETVRACIDSGYYPTNARLALDRIAARVSELEEDRPDLEACAELIVKLDENGPAKGNRERVKLLADWQRVRKPR